MTTTELDPGKVEEFAGRMVGLMNSSMLSLMTSVGHRTGLFDTMAGLPPSTSAEVAKAAGLDERYVREWLNAMTVGHFVDYDPAKPTYVLPPSTRRADPRRRPREPRQHDPVHRVDGRRRGRDRRVLPQGRRRALLAVPEVPGPDGRDERAGARRRPDQRRVGPRRRADRPATRRASTSSTSAAVRVTPST